MPKYALIVAGGSGQRMQSQIPKQFLLLRGKPILQHTLEAFHAFDSSVQLVLVLPADQIDHWKSLRQTHSCQVPHAIMEGGQSRFQSVRQGLALVPPEAVVAIHDGVRPFVDKRMLEEGFKMAIEKGSAIATMPLKESLRQLKYEKSQAVNRSEFCMVQTPQVFQARRIKQAYRQAEDSQFTDCASVAEAAGQVISLYTGSYRNIKITTPEDLLWAESLLKNKELRL
jgi:2-C-methyl-D-erythritol 4-phosphate cytidylyltransferase